jgi:arylsulfatase A-like enzyme/thioredoxin-like negative regulator of GroEL
VARTFRFTFILALAALCTGLAAVGGWRYARASAPVNGPIILISIDTLRADHLPAYGYRKVSTPSIDTLAADGTVFERAYSHSPQTLPAHVSLLSGRLPFETGVRDNVGFAVKTGERLLPQMLRERGFTTAGIVSAYTLRRETGIDRGFDFFDDGTMPGVEESSALPALQRDGTESEAIAEHWLDQQNSSRVFLFLHLYEPHAPYTSPPEYAAYSPYDGEIAYVDEIVGRLIRYLKSHQLYDRSTIILVSDHGEGLGDHGEQQHGLFVYEEAIRVPLIVKQAGGVGAGRRVGDVVQHVDLVPTILNFAKAPVPGNLRGRSLESVLDGNGRLEPRAVYSEALFGFYHFGWAPITALTDQRHRYIRAPHAELYDLQADPRERDNIAEEHEQVRKTLDKGLEGLTASRPAPSPQDVSAEEREHFDALGYVGSHLDSKTAAGDLPDPKDSAHVLEVFRQAAQLAAEGRFTPSIEALRRVTRDDPTMADAWRQLGRVSARAGRLEQAVLAFERSASLVPDDTGSLISAASLLLRLGRFDEAQREAEKAVARAPERSAPSFAAEQTLATILVARKDYDGAREQAANAVRNDPSVPLDSYIEGLVLAQQGRYEDALPNFLKAAAALQTGHVRLPDLHYYTGDTLAHLDRWDESIPEFKQELDLFPRNLPARAGLARAYHAAGLADEAERALDEVTAVAPTPEGYALAARTWTIIGYSRRAEALRAEARRRFAGDPSSSFSRGRVDARYTAKRKGGA